MAGAIPKDACESFYLWLKGHKKGWNKILKLPVENYYAEVALHFKYLPTYENYCLGKISFDINTISTALTTLFSVDPNSPDAKMAKAEQLILQQGLVAKSE